MENLIDKKTKPILADTHWRYLAISEGFAKTVELWIYKIISAAFSIFPIAYLVSFIVGFVQMLGGLIINRRSKYAVLPGKKYVIGSLILGVLSFYTIVVYSYIFYASTINLAFVAFIVSLSVVPKFLIDKILYKEGVQLSHFLSIPVFIFAVYAFLDFPSLTNSTYPLWFWLALTLPVVTILEEYIKKPFKVGVISVWVRNFWSGVSTAFLSIVFIATVKPPVSYTVVNSISSDSWVLMFALGLAVLAGAFARQRTYMRGGAIMPKQILMIVTFLVSAILVGILAFSDGLGFGIVIGVVSLIISYFLVESESIKTFVEDVRPTPIVYPIEVLEDFDLDNLVIFEMSKNHGGDLGNALRIVREFAEVAKEKNIRAAVKLQFRNLDSYIHPDYRNGGDERMQRYFTSHLSDQDFAKVVSEIKSRGLLSMCTPFDEESVDTIDNLGVEIIKVASSSAKDWPLLERIVESRKPIVCSTGRLELPEIDDLVEFFKSHNANFALLHCVGMYPTPDEYKELNRIDVMKKRYPDVIIGLSTHEDPNDMDIVKMAYAKGVRLYEKHVAILNERFNNDPSFKKVLGYTATADQMRRWIDSYNKAALVCGTDFGSSYIPTDKERKSVGSMVRGMYFRNPIRAGQRIEREDVFFAIPYSDENLHAGDWQEGMIADKDYRTNEAVSRSIRYN